MSFNANFARKKIPESQRKSYYIEKLFANAFERARPFSIPIITNADQYVNSQESFRVIDTQERGELIYAEIATNSVLMIPEIILYDELKQPITIINNLTFLQLLQLGRGMTPGDVQAAAPGQTQDWTSHFIPNMFHIARYKDDNLSDWTANNNVPTSADRWVVGRFVASVPIPYSAISFYVKNTTTDVEPKKIHSFSLARTVYETGADLPLIENPQPSAVEVPNIAEVDENEVELNEEVSNTVYPESPQS